MAGFNFDEQSVRRIVQSVLRTERLPRNLNENPRPRRPMKGEDFRLIRGQSVGPQSGPVVQVDNVDVLAGGLDPSSGSAGALVSIANTFFPRVFLDDQWIQAVYNQDVGGTDINWETLETGTGTGAETFRLVWGTTTGTVEASSGTFLITNVMPLAGGLDPVSGSATAELEVVNSRQEEFDIDEPITAISDSISPWRTLIVERYRLVRGDFAGTAGTFPDIIRIDNLETLASSVDPRIDPADENEELLVKIASGEEFSGTVGDKIYAAYNYDIAQFGAESVDWEMLSADQQLHIVVGQTQGVVGAQESAFSIDNLELISGFLPEEPLVVQQVFPVGYAATQGVLSIKASNGLWINTPDAGKVRTSGSDVFPEFLYDTLINKGVFEAGTHQEVFAQELDIGGGNRQVFLFTGSGGAGTGFECSGTPGVPLQDITCELEIMGDNLVLTLNKFWCNEMTGTSICTIPVMCGTGT